MCLRYDNDVVSHENRFSRKLVLSKRPGPATALGGNFSPVPTTAAYTSPVIVSHRSVRYLLFYFQSLIYNIYKPFLSARTHHDYLKAYSYIFFFIENDLFTFRPTKRSLLLFYINKNILCCAQVSRALRVFGGVLQCWYTHLHIVNFVSRSNSNSLN